MWERPVFSEIWSQDHYTIGHKTNNRVWYYNKQCQCRMLFFEADIKKTFYNYQDEFPISWCKNFFMKIQTFVISFFVEIYQYHITLEIVIFCWSKWREMFLLNLLTLELCNIWTLLSIQHSTFDQFQCKYNFIFDFFKNKFIVVGISTIEDF